MKSEWMAWCHGGNLHLDGEVLEVLLSEGRKQRIRVHEEEEELVLTSRAAQAADASDLERLSLRLWERNRSTSLVGFRIDVRGHVIAESVLPRLGLTRSEFQVAVRSLAEEADRLEFLLTGKNLL